MLFHESRTAAGSSALPPTHSSHSIPFPHHFHAPKSVYMGRHSQTAQHQLHQQTWGYWAMKLVGDNDCIIEKPSWWSAKRKKKQLYLIPRHLCTHVFWPSGQTSQIIPLSSTVFVDEAFPNPKKAHLTKVVKEKWHRVIKKNWQFFFLSQSLVVSFPPAIAGIL